jgi:hypothetical protein
MKVIIRKLILMLPNKNYIFYAIVDATGKKVRGKPEGKVDDYDQYGMLILFNKYRKNNLHF